MITRFYTDEMEMLAEVEDSVILNAGQTVTIHTPKVKDIFTVKRANLSVDTTKHTSKIVQDVFVDIINRRGK